MAEALPRVPLPSGGAPSPDVPLGLRFEGGRVDGRGLHAGAVVTTIQENNLELAVAATLNILYILICTVFQWRTSNNQTLHSHIAAE